MRRNIREAKHDISADVYQWFNTHCNDVIDNGGRHGLEDLQYNLEDADVSMFADEAMDVLVAEYGWSSRVIEDYRDQIEYDIEKLIKDALDYIEYGDSSTLSFSRDKADWMDRYRDNDEYTASLESRIIRLEKLVRKYR